MSRTPVIRVAIVQYRPGGSTYTARCARRDIDVGAQVDVRSAEGDIDVAEVVAIQHERWHCTRLEVVGLVSEVEWDLS
jgi:hypothetical protein